MSAPLRIAFLGTSAFALPALRSLAAGPDEVAAVFTRPDRPAGRGRRFRPPPVKEAAEELGLPVYQPERVSVGAGLEQLRALQPDLLLVAAFGEILKEEALSLPRLGPVNLHASLLPRYRGAAPIQRALLAGEEETGVTAQWMAKGLDTGDILLQRALPIDPEENFGSLHDRLADLAAEVALETLDLLRTETAPRLPQNHAAATFAPPIQREELLINWAQPAVRVLNTIRAFSPYPGARTFHQGKLLKILAARLVEKPEAERGQPGEIVEFCREGLRLQTGSDSLLILQVQPEGRTPMSAGDYALGHRLPRGQILGPDVSE